MSPRKLSDEDVRRIKADIDRVSDRQLALKYGVSETQIEAIAVGHIYADVRLPRQPRPSRFYPGARSRAAR